MGRGVPHTCWLLLALCLTGILAGDWSVDHFFDQVCAGIGSSLTLDCSYDYPQSSGETGAEGQRSAEEHEYKVLSEMWCVGDSRCITPRYVFHSDGIFLDPAYQNRVEYLGDPETKNCSLRISDLKESDTGTYVFYLITNHPTQKMPEQRGIQLLVADSDKVSVLRSPCGDIIEGKNLELACCSFDLNSSYTWHKGTDTTPAYYGMFWKMSAVTAYDAGSYYCQVETGNEVQKSTQIIVDVQYPPHAIGVSIFYAGGSQQGFPVTLNCSSDDANPSVNTYTWYQGRDACAAAVEGTASHSRAKGTGQILRIANISEGEDEIYCCVASNKHGSKSILVPLSASRESVQLTSHGWTTVIVGVLIAVVAIIGLVALIMWRRQRSASSHQSYALAETTATAP